MTKVLGVRPVLDQQGQQKTWTNNDGKVNYIFEYALDNGMRGEVMHQQPQPRFPAGSEVVATDATKNPQYPKLKLEKPGGGSFAAGGKRPNDPEYNARLQASGLVQAAITAGAKTEAEVLAIARVGIKAAAMLKAEIMASQPAQPPATSDPQVAYAAPVRQPQQNAANPFAQAAPMATHHYPPMDVVAGIAGTPVAQPAHSGEDLPW